MSEAMIWLFTATYEEYQLIYENFYDLLISWNKDVIDYFVRFIRNFKKGIIKVRKNHRIAPQCKICKECVVMEKGKHTISFKCLLNGEFTPLNYLCDDYDLDKDRISELDTIGR